MFTTFANTIALFRRVYLVGGGLLTLVIVVLLVLFVRSPRLNIRKAEFGFWVLNFAVAVPRGSTLGTTWQSTLLRGTSHAEKLGTKHLFVDGTTPARNAARWCRTSMRMSASSVRASRGSRPRTCWLRRANRSLCWATARGGGQTQRTTAHLSNALDDRYFEIEWLHGSEGAKLAADSHTAAIDRIESIIGEERIACDFVRLDGYLFSRAVSLLTCWTASCRRLSGRARRCRASPACAASLLRYWALSAISPPAQFHPLNVPERGRQGHRVHRRADLHRGRTRKPSRAASRHGSRHQTAESSPPMPSWWQPTRRSTISWRSTPNRPPT